MGARPRSSACVGARRSTGLVLAALFLSVAPHALAQTQIDTAPVSASASFDTITVGEPLVSNVQAVGNNLAVTLSGAFQANVSQQVAPPGAQVVAETTVNDVHGDANILNVARGNAVTIEADAGVGVLAGSLRPLLQAAGPGDLEATTTVTGGGFGSLDIVSASIGNDIALTSANGQTALGDIALGPAGAAQQVNTTTSSAQVAITSVTVSGALNGEAQAVGNLAQAGVDGAGIVAGGLDLVQTNTADHTATANLSHATLAGTGNGLAATASGNLANFGTASNGVVTQSDVSTTLASVNVADSTVNGRFAATATGNAMSFVASTADTLVSQETSGSQTAAVVGQRLVLNGPATFAASAFGNQFSGTQPPGVIPGSQFQQHDDGSPPTASVSLSDISGAGDVTVVATAVGNYATLNNPSGFLQGASTGMPNATVTLTNITASGGMSVQTTTLANSVVIH